MKHILQEVAEPLTIRKIEATVLINQKEQVIELEGGTAFDLATSLLELEVPKLGINIPKAVTEAWKQTAEQMYDSFKIDPTRLNETPGMWFIKMYQTLKAEMYHRTEREKQVNHALIMNYEQKIKDLKNQVESLKKQIR